MQGLVNVNKNFTLVNSAKAINFKSTGKERLKGDTIHHYGNIPRMVQIQTLMYNL